eukprot:RCo007873
MQGDGEQAHGLYDEEPPEGLSRPTDSAGWLTVVSEADLTVATGGQPSEGQHSRSHPAPPRMCRITTTELYDKFALATAKEVLRRNQAVTRGFDEERAYVLRKASRAATRDKWDECRGRFLDLLLSRCAAARCSTCRRHHHCHSAAAKHPGDPTCGASCTCEAESRVIDGAVETPKRAPPEKPTQQVKPRRRPRRNSPQREKEGGTDTEDSAAPSGAASVMRPAENARRRRAKIPPVSGGWAAPVVPAPLSPVRAPSSLPRQRGRAGRGQGLPRELRRSGHRHPRGGGATAISAGHA